MKRFVGNGAMQELINIIKQKISDSMDLINERLSTHVNDKENPHNVTIQQIGASPTIHNHDDRYYTETEMNTKLLGKSDITHTHDDRYYTESEINTKLSEINTRVEQCFQSASDGKDSIVGALTGVGIKGTSPSTNDDFTVMANKITNGFNLVEKVIGLSVSNASETVVPTGNQYGLSSVTASITLQEKTKSITSGNANVTPDTGKVLSKVTIKGPANKGSTTVDAASVTQDTDYTYLGIPAAGYYNTESKVRASNSTLYDAIYNALVAQGVTPASKDPSVLTASIATVATNKYNAGVTAGYNTGVAAVSYRNEYATAWFETNHDNKNRHRTFDAVAYFSGSVIGVTGVTNTVNEYNVAAITISGTAVILTIRVNTDNYQAWTIGVYANVV